jgi:hypothetical protein
MDQDGLFPDGENVYGEEINDSNAAFRDLMDYVDGDERIFSVSGSAWGAGADNVTTSPSDMLQSGENHFSYVAGLRSSSKGLWPVVVDGTNGSGTYGSVEGEKGGLWRGKKAIVVRVDSSAKAERLRGEDGERYIPKHDDPQGNALSVESYMGSAARLLNPAG